MDSVGQFAASGGGLQKHEFEGWLMLGHDAGLL